MDAPTCPGAQVFVVVSQVPDQVGQLAAARRPVVGDAGDAAQRVVGLGAGGVHLTDDRVFGPFDGRQGVHRGTHTGSAELHAYRSQFTRRVGKAQFGCLGEQFDDVVESSVVNGGRVEVNQVGQRQPVRYRDRGLAGHARPLLRRMSNMQRKRVCPVCCIQTRTGDSSSVGSGVSVGSVVTVTVGLGTSP